MLLIMLEGFSHFKKEGKKINKREGFKGKQYD